MKPRKEEEWTTVSSWRYYQQSPVTTSPQVWRRRPDVNFGIYDNIHSIKEQRRQMEQKKLKTKVMSPWRSNQIYQGLGAAGGPMNVLDFEDDNEDDIYSDTEMCAGDFEIELYPSMTSLDKISEGSSKSVGKISRFLNSLFRKRNKATKEGKIKLIRTSSCPKNMAVNGMVSELVESNNPPVPPRNVSLSLKLSPKKSFTDSDIEENGRGEIRRTRRVKRQAPVPPAPRIETYVASRNTVRSIAIINEKNVDIETKWVKQVTSSAVFTSKIEQNCCNNKERAIGNTKVINRKKRRAPVPPKEVPSRCDLKTDETSKNLKKETSIYATWPKKPPLLEKSAKLEVSINDEVIKPNRWTCKTSRRKPDQQEDEMLKIYIPLPQKREKDFGNSQKLPKNDPKISCDSGEKVKNGKAIWGRTTNDLNKGSVRSLAKAFDDMSVKDSKPNGSIKAKQKVPIFEDSGQKSEFKKDPPKPIVVQNKPPPGPAKGSRRRKSRKKDPCFAKKRLSPLFESTEQKNQIEEEIAALLNDLPDRNGNDATDISCLEMASSGSVHVNKLFRKLSIAISSGQYDRAAILARQLAMLKAQCSTTQQKDLSANTSPEEKEKVVSVSMYIEDRDTHHGPIPLNLSPKMTLKLLKTMVEYHFGFPAVKQRWILGKALATEDNLKLVDFGITQGCSIFLYLVHEVSSPVPSRKNGQPVDKVSVIDNVKDSPIKEVTNNGARPKDPKFMKYKNSERKIENYVEKSSSNEKLGNLEEINGLENDHKRVRPEEGLEPMNINFEIEEVVDSGQVDDTLKNGPNNVVIEEEEEERDSESENESSSEEFVEDELATKETSPLATDKTDEINFEEEIIENDVIEVKNEEDKGKDLLKMMEMQENQDLIPNIEEFECVVCFCDVPANEGVILRECLHSFCKECLANAIEFCEDAMVKCPYRDDNYSCQSHLLDREIKTLVSEEIYEKHLQRSIRKAESQDSKSFHCKTPNCTGWCLYEDNVNVFDCPVCKKQNCLNCQAIHEGRNCLQYQEELEFQESKNDDVKKTRRFLDSMITEGSAMRCPKCQVVVLKKWGCDWLKCCVCDTEICWVTKGPRWGPGGKGDTSGGCRCRVNGLKCHPLCNYCH